MHHFVVIGQVASASADFSLTNLPATSGRLDVLLRCVRAALLVSHGVRREARLYLVLRGGASAPRVLRFDGETAKFLRPDERSLAILVHKTLAAAGPHEGFETLRPGIAQASGDLELALSDLGPRRLYLLEQGGTDIRQELLADDAVFIVGDHLGIDDATSALLLARGATPVGVGPRSLHSDDVLTLVSNELDRQRDVSRA